MCNRVNHGCCLYMNQSYDSSLLHMNQSGLRDHTLLISYEWVSPNGLYSCIVYMNQSSLRVHIAVLDMNQSGLRAHMSHQSPELWKSAALLWLFGWLVVLLFYVHGKHLRSCRDGQLT